MANSFTSMIYAFAMPDQSTEAMAVTSAAIPLAPDKELDLLVKSIEEASKHTREVLIVLLVASFYILIAVFASKSTETVQLPLLSITVSNSLFLAVSPLLVALPYLYLQLCVRDLKERIRYFDSAAIQIAYVPNQRILLYPFWVTRGLAERCAFLKLTPKERFDRRRSPQEIYLWLATITLIWGFAPLILAILWIRFIDRQQLESLIPCLALIASLYGSAFDTKRTKFAKAIGAAVSLSLVGISLASVESLRSHHLLGATWAIASQAGRFMLAHGSHGVFIGVLWGAFCFGAIQVASLFTFERERHKYKQLVEETWLRLSYSKSSWSRMFATRLLYVFAMYPLHVSSFLVATIALVVGFSVGLFTN